MPNSDPRGRECSLADLPRGSNARVVEVAADNEERLAAHGVHAGTVVRVEGDAPFRGPRIVRVNSARLALARSLVRGIRVRPVDEAGRR